MRPTPPTPQHRAALPDTDDGNLGFIIDRMISRGELVEFWRISRGLTRLYRVDDRRTQPEASYMIWIPDYGDEFHTDARLLPETVYRFFDEARGETAPHLGSSIVLDMIRDPNAVLLTDTRGMGKWVTNHLDGRIVVYNLGLIQRNLTG